MLAYKCKFPFCDLKFLVLIRLSFYSNCFPAGLRVIDGLSHTLLQDFTAQPSPSCTILAFHFLKSNIWTIYTVNLPFSLKTFAFSHSVSAFNNLVTSLIALWNMLLVVLKRRRNEPSEFTCVHYPEENWVLRLGVQMFSLWW